MFSSLLSLGLFEEIFQNSTIIGCVTNKFSFSFINKDFCKVTNESIKWLISTLIIAFGILYLYNCVCWSTHPFITPSPVVVSTWPRCCPLQDCHVQQSLLYLSKLCFSKVFKFGRCSDCCWFSSSFIWFSFTSHYIMSHISDFTVVAVIAALKFV